MFSKVKLFDLKHEDVVDVINTFIADKYNVSIETTPNDIAIVHYDTVMEINHGVMKISLDAIADLKKFNEIDLTKEINELVNFELDAYLKRVKELEKE